MAKSSGSGNNIDLSKLSIEELQTLAQDIEREIVSRREAERERVLTQMRELAASLGMSLEEVLRTERGKGGGGIVPPKYRNPNDPSLTWTGRGKRPTWVNEALASGKSLEDLAISS
jgi:DNA-binding protein H-NS